MKIATLATGDGTVDIININYVPAMLYYIAATQLTSLKVTVPGDGVIIDCAVAGLNGLGVMRRYGAVANSYYIPIATGFIPEKVCEIVTVNSGAQTPTLYGHSFNLARTVRGSNVGYIRTVREVVLSTSAKIFKDFAYLVIDSPTTSDIIDVGFQDGHKEIFESTELLAWVSQKQYATGVYVIDNLDFNINYVRYSPSTNRTIYVTRFVESKEMI